MHILNTLPQRLDPSATPTFAGVIAPSLTSPASNNLTLGLGTGGTALTLASSTLAATFAGSVTAAGAGSFTTADATQTFRIKGATGMLRVAGYVDAANGTGMYALNAAENAYIPFFLNASEISLNISGTPKLTIGTTGNVSIASSTAGSSSAGALVVTGGLSTGAASYFGGAVTTSGSFNFNTATSQLWWAIGAQADSRSWAFLNDAVVEGNFSLYRSLANTNSYLGAVVLNFDKAGAATFAGAVTVGTDGIGGGGANKIIFNYEAHVDSRSWKLVNDLDKFGDFAFTQSTTRTGSIYAKVFRLTESGNGEFSGTISPQQATTAAAPAYAKGAIYFDTTLNKLRVGGATAWETITSV